MVAKSVKKNNGGLIFGKPEHQGQPFCIRFFFLIESTSQKLLDLLRMLRSVPHINLDKVHLSTPRSLCMAPGTVNRQQRFDYQEAVSNDSGIILFHTITAKYVKVKSICFEYGCYSIQILMITIVFKKINRYTDIMLNQNTM